MTGLPRSRSKVTLQSIAVEIWAEAIGAVAVLSLGLAILMTMGAWFRVIDAINQLAPFIFAAGLVVLGLAFSVRKAAPVIVLLAALAVCVMGVRVVPDLVAAAFQQLPTSRTLASQPSIKLVAFNLHGWSMPDPAPSVRWLLETDPDYIVLLEAGGTSGQAVLEATSSRYPHRVTCGQSTCMSIILAKQPILKPGIVESPWASATFLAPGGKGSIAIMGAHTAWPLDRPLNLLAPTATHQADQYTRIAAQVRQLGADRTILAGDFNSGGWSHALNAMVKSAGLRRHSQALFSWPAYPVWRRLPPGPVVPIDHVMAGSDWALKSIKRGPALGSDHYPLVAELVWQGSGSIQPDVEAGR
jgi:endonuclease/exonuclease/phosphatase (EEP) superfamily protein YafD